MNKKAQVIMAKEVPKILFYLVFLVIISFVLVFTVSIFSTTKIMEDVLEKHVPLSIIWGSSDCLAYSQGNRVFRGIIDSQKLNEERKKLEADVLYEAKTLALSFESNEILVLSNKTFCKK